MASTQAASPSSIKLKLKLKPRKQSNDAADKRPKWNKAIWGVQEDVKPDILVLPELLDSLRCPDLNITTTPNLLKHLRLAPAMPLSALPANPTQWTPHVLLSISLHYRTATMAEHFGFSEEKMKACLKHTAKWHAYVIDRTEGEVRALCWEYKRRHSRFYQTKEMTKCCGAGGIVKERREKRGKTLARLEKRNNSGVLAMGRKRRATGKGRPKGNGKAKAEAEAKNEPESGMEHN